MTVWSLLGTRGTQMNSVGEMEVWIGLANARIACLLD